MFEQLAERGFEITCLHHAEAILQHDLGQAAHELEEALLAVRIPTQELIEGGGGKAKVTQRLGTALHSVGWKHHNFTIETRIDGVPKESQSHEVDHVKKFGEWTIAAEIEWNNKDPFFDRDLENFKHLHTEGAISVGGIITRGSSLQRDMFNLIKTYAEKNNFQSVDDLLKFYYPTPRQVEGIEKWVAKGNTFPEGWAKVFVADKYGQSTTHWNQLKLRMDRGVGNPCPLLLIGLPASVIC